MTPEQKDLLKYLFTTGFLRRVPNLCRADMLWERLADLEEAERREHPDWIDKQGRPMLPWQIGCMPTQAFDVLVAFYLEHRDEEGG